MCPPPISRRSASTNRRERRWGRPSVGRSGREVMKFGAVRTSCAEWQRASIAQGLADPFQIIRPRVGGGLGALAVDTLAIMPPFRPPPVTRRPASGTQTLGRCGEGPSRAERVHRACSSMFGCVGSRHANTAFSGSRPLPTRRRDRRARPPSLRSREMPLALEFPLDARTKSEHAVDIRWETLERRER